MPVKGGEMEISGPSQLKPLQALVEVQLSRKSVSASGGSAEVTLLQCAPQSPEDSDYLFLVAAFFEAHGPLVRESIFGFSQPPCSFSCVKLLFLPHPHPVHRHKQGWEGG